MSLTNRNANTRTRLAALATILALATSVTAQITSNATCLSQYSDLYNSKGQSPCLVAAFLGGVCNNDQFDVSGVSDGAFYVGPSGEQTSLCECSSVYYSLISACAYCQNSSTLSWSDWKSDCPSNVTHVASFPLSIPADTAVPGWAYENVTVAGIFNVGEAMSDDSPESTALSSIASSTSTHSVTKTLQVTASMSSSSYSSSSPSSKSYATSSSTSISSHTGLIIGVAVGAVAGVAAVAVLAFYLGRRMRSARGPASADKTKSRGNAWSGASGEQKIPLMNEKEYGESKGYGKHSPLQTATTSPEPPRFYNPNDPSTFPNSPPPNSLGLSIPSQTHSYNSSYPPTASTAPLIAPPSRYAYRGVPEV